jgi:NAD(P)-dependent dehydrogenase (short-subunit alcohol dehydrogenase family)
MTIEQKFPYKRAFITGAASGLGLAICERLAPQGWKLLIADINAERLAQAEKRLQALGAETLSMVIDVTEYSALQDAANSLLETWGGVDLVFNNAGIATAGAIDELSIQDWERSIDVDLWSVIYGCKIFTPMLKAQGGGYIINTASSAGTLAGPEMAAYNVAKAGVVSLSETLKVELSKDNIGVTVICPTVFVTSLGETLTTGRTMENNLVRQLEQSKVTPEHIVDDLMLAMEKNRLYVMTQADARWGWRLKRFFPEFYTTIIGYFYRNKKWIYAE